MEDNNRMIGAVVILICMIAYSIYSGIQKKLRDGRKRKILAEGIQANAKVLQIEPTGEYANNQPEFQVKVQIEGESGEVIAEMREVLTYSKYDQIRQGSNVLVKYDPAFEKYAILL